MNNYILIHYGEISLKGKNQPQFRMQLLKNIRLSLKSADIDWPIKHYRGYLSLEVLQKEKTEIAQKKLEQVFGIVWFSPAIRYHYQGFDSDSVAGILNTIEKQTNIKEICSFCDKEKPINELRKTIDNKNYVCRYIEECEVLKEI